MTWESPEAHQRVEDFQTARAALMRLPGHVYLSCAGAGVEPCAWCQVLVALDHAERSRPHESTTGGQE